MGKGKLSWCKMDLGTLHDPKVMQLVEEDGPEGAAVWFAVILNMYSAMNDGYAFLPAEAMCRRVSSDLNLSKQRTKKRLENLAKIGLIDAEMWAEGKVANERATEFYTAYLRKRETVAQNRSKIDPPNVSPNVSPNVRG